MRENKVCRYGCQPAIGCSEGVIEARGPGEVALCGAAAARARPLGFVGVAGTDPYTSAVPERAAPKVGVNRAGD